MARGVVPIETLKRKLRKLDPREPQISPQRGVGRALADAEHEEAEARLATLTDDERKALAFAHAKARIDALPEGDLQTSLGEKLKNLK